MKAVAGVVSSRPIVTSLSAAEPLVRSPAPVRDPIVSACHDAQAFHFQTQLSGGDLVVVEKTASAKRER